MYRLFLLFFAFCSLAYAETISGRCVTVSDGDTVTIQLADNTQRKVRLWGIDAPEKQQDFGLAAKRKLSDLIFNKDVQVEAEEKDKYGRSIGKIYYEGEYINLEMLIAGMAWHYVKYAPNDTDLAEAEKFARSIKRGLWSDSNPTPPWDFHLRKKDKTPQPKKESIENYEEVTLIRVSGADSLTVQTNSGMMTTIFLYGCDAPENGQQLYKESKKELTEIIGKQKIRIMYADDGSKRGKRIAKVYAGEDYVNERLMERGYAHIPPTCKDEHLREAREKARANNTGLWVAGAAFIAPWAYRQIADARNADAQRRWYEQQLKDRLRQEREYEERLERARERRREASWVSEPVSTGGKVHVSGYTRKDGTKVRAHTRSK